ncbi:MAG: decaprenyl-phosphate phosphoribosyltransferase [Anaerolineae bacterium]|nr:decaprenyl-phosphate phosphoribosyltransferase [Anaerolineae bacterium]
MILETKRPMLVPIALLRTMRPRQWTKNGFVFAGILFDQKLSDPNYVLRVLMAFGLLCLAASTIYLINDLVDIEKDRLHPKKKFRPLPSGQLPVVYAIGTALIFPIVALIGGWMLSPALAGVLLAYLALHIAYSFALKNIVLVDVFAIAGGFVLRVIAGVVVIDVQNFSPWLYVCAGLLSLFLAIGKRRQELLLLGDDASKFKATYNSYTLELLDDMLRLVLAGTAIAYTLYATEAETRLAAPEYMLLTVPVVYFALFRYLFIIHVRKEGGDPTEVLFIDRPLQVSIVTWVAMILVFLYLV